MPRVTGTHGANITYEVLGVAETLRMLKQKGFDITKGANIGCVQAGALMEEEVKESIAGRRGEPRSVDTGHMMQMVNVDTNMYFVAFVYGGAEYTQYLERGTSRIPARNHFKNTLTRQTSAIIADVKNAVKK